jgi:DNA-binding SARP family transcriptional activator
LIKHSQTKVYDEIENVAANVENPVWYVDRYVKWKKLNAFKFEGIQGIAKDEGNGRLFFVDKHAVYVFNNRTSVLDTIPFNGGSPYLTTANQFVYNKFTDELWSYDFDNSTICKFNFITHKWSSSESDTKEPNFWQHNKFISTVDSSLVTLFGYGFYTYKSIIHRYKTRSKSWEELDRSNQIEPRYLSSAGFLNNKEMLVFGGYGSKSGHQELSPETYYDLYSLNLTDYSFKKLWNLNRQSASLVPSESLVADQEAGVFYTLLYNRGNYATYMRLAKFGIEKSEFELFNDSIPYSFLDTKSSNDLFLDRKTSQLIAVTSHNSDIALYSIGYPPLMQQDVIQSEPVKGKWYIWVLGVIGAFAIALLYIFIIRKKSRKNKGEVLFEHALHPHILPIEPMERNTMSSIYILGEFQIYDHHGTNIASALSPMLKQLFLYIFLNTSKNSRGVASTKLDEVLWNDKFGESARNNRNVNISKLRTILEKVEGFEFVNDNSFWKIKAGEPLWCDYTRILSLLKKSRHGALAEVEINELISLLSAGEFLPEIQADWIEVQRNQFVSETVEGLASLFNEKIVRNNFTLCYNLAECILVYDHLNEEALAMKCLVLCKMGKKNIAKNFFDSFCREYKQEFGNSYPGTFNTIIK